MTTPTTIDNVGVSIHGAGARATQITYAGSRDAILIKPRTFTIVDAGTFAGFTVNVTGSGNGIHVVTPQHARFYDVSVRGAASGAGFWLDNQAGGWTERTAFINCESYHNAKGFRFTVNGGKTSFGRTHFIATQINVSPGQIGVSVEGGANVYDSIWELSGNMDGTGATASLFSLDSTPSIISSGEFAVHFECQNTACTRLNMAAGSQLLGKGIISLIANGEAISDSIAPTAHYHLDREGLQQEFGLGIGPWLFPATVNGQEGLGLNARWDGSNWQCNGDGGNNGCSIIVGLTATGAIVFYGLNSSGGKNQSATNATMTNGPIADFQPRGQKSIFKNTYMSTSSGNELLCSGTQPTIASGFNTSGNSIGASPNGTCSFLVNVGTGRATNTGVLTMPASSTGWNCFATNFSRADFIAEAANSKTSVTLANYGTTFTPTNFTNSDIILVSCFGR